MATNPMQRRARNSFLIGFFVALLIMALIVAAILYKMKGMKEEMQAILDLQQKDIFVAATDLKSGTPITMEDLRQETVQTTINPGQFITLADLEGDTAETEDDEESSILIRTDVPAGTIITKDLLEAVDDRTTNDQRMQEYNMIILPTKLETGEYIDIRFKLPTGEDYIVVSKKYVEDSNADTVWMKMREDEILTLGNAIVEAYTITGSKLYATIYTEAGRQEAATQTYPVNSQVLALIENDANIVEEAKSELYKRYNANDRAQSDQRENHINSALSDSVDDAKGMNDAVQTGTQEEVTKLQDSRQQYIDSLGGAIETQTTTATE